jgi:hypothetical protein
MKEERQQQRPEAEAEDHAEVKSDDERELEEKWSQGGQDVEEAQHDEPESPA